MKKIRIILSAVLLTCAMMIHAGFVQAQNRSNKNNTQVGNRTAQGAIASRTPSAGAANVQIRISGYLVDLS